MTKLSSLSKIVPLFLCMTGWTAAEERRPSIEANIDAAPESKVFADKSVALCTEWYGKINEILFDKDHPLPADKVRLIFKPMKGVAHTTNADIYVSAEWITKQPNDYGMVIHELTHVVQNYGGKVKGEDGWLTEGIADYIRHKYFEKDIEKLRVGPRSSYKQGYTIAAAFLFWLETKKDAELVHKLNAALHDGAYTSDFFNKNCGASLEDLWKDFLHEKYPDR